MLSALAAARAGVGQTIRGSVVDDPAGQPLPEALVSLLDTAGRPVGAPNRSTDAGSFVLIAPAPGTYRVRATRIGFQPVTSAPVNIAMAELITVRLRMSAQIQELRPIEVVERRQLAASELTSMMGFELRRSQLRGLGRAFFIPADMKHFATFRDLAYDARAPGTLHIVEIRDPWWGTLEVLQFGACLPDIYLDGLEIFAIPPFTRPNNVRAATALSHLQALPIDWMQGIEMYRRSDHLPLRLAGFLNESGNPCGLIAVWTRKAPRSDAVPLGVVKPPF